MVASVPMIIADFIKELRFRPRCIEVKKSVLHDLLCTLLEETGIKVIQAKTIEPVEEVFEDFLKYLDNSQVQ